MLSRIHFVVFFLQKKKKDKLIRVILWLRYRPTCNGDGFLYPSIKDHVTLRCLDWIKLRQ